MRPYIIAFLLAAVGLAVAMPASAQQTIRIGELNSYKAQPAFLEPYRKRVANGD
jgi:branched-chain amino acid transport system substrate-binding protein